MKLLGITGLKQSGKDTVADIIIRKLIPANAIKLGFADALKDEVAKAFGITREYIENNKSHFRLILQGVGTDYRRQLCGDNYWVNKLGQRILQLRNVDLLIIPDVRFLNEASFILEAGGKLIRVVRGSENKDAHASEQEQNLIIANQTIDNSNTIEDLEQIVSIVITNLKLK